MDHIEKYVLCNTVKIGHFLGFMCMGWGVEGRRIDLESRWCNLALVIGFVIEALKQLVVCLAP